MKKISWIICSLLSIALQAQQKKINISNSVCSITMTPSPGKIWRYQLLSTHKTIDITPPSFEIDGKMSSGETLSFTMYKTNTLRNGVSTYVAEGPLKADPSILLSVYFSLSKNNPVVRFRYKLTSGSIHHFTKKDGADHLQYFSVSFANTQYVKEIRLSDFNEKCHATLLSENNIDNRFFDDRQAVMGPLLEGGDKDNTFLLAYEHGSEYPDRFLEFQLSANKDISLSAVKGNYLNHQLLDEENDYQTVWFEIAAVKGNEEELAAAYRIFMLKYITENAESRKPYIFYNTWGRQERDKWAGGKYLSRMNLETTLHEIEVAHQLGVEVYVLDMGWFQKAGDWQVNGTLFPDSLKQVKALLDKYGMKLGLWLNPLVAAKTSIMLARNRQNAVVWNGKADDPFPIWETEESVRLSLVSPYWKQLAAKLISLIKEYGVGYFKWDGVEQYAANGTGHYYGNEENTQTERTESYAFQLPLYMTRIVDSVTSIYPETIFDYDITEGKRCVGLQFLSSGKYFMMNNGPYFHNYDLASTWGSPLPTGNANVFVNPGPARGWFTRSVLCYDKWIPSVLFLTHYQPDTPRSSQLINIASLILGQNGIWGDLLKLSPDDIGLFHHILEKYKAVRDDMTESNPVVTGETGMSPEIHEKIKPGTGRGAIVVFANAPGSYDYITRNRVTKINWHTEGLVVHYDEKGRALIHLTFTEGGAKIIFFGTE